MSPPLPLCLEYVCFPTCVAGEAGSGCGAGKPLRETIAMVQVRGSVNGENCVLQKDMLKT